MSHYYGFQSNIHALLLLLTLNLLISNTLSFSSQKTTIRTNTLGAGPISVNPQIQIYYGWTCKQYKYHLGSPNNLRSKTSTNAQHDDNINNDDEDDENDSDVMKPEKFRLPKMHSFGLNSRSTSTQHKVIEIFGCHSISNVDVDLIYIYIYINKITHDSNSNPNV